MSLLVVTDVSCDECGDWTEGDAFSTYRPKGKLARANAKRKGWIRVREDGRWKDLCPVCVKQRGT